MPAADTCFHCALPLNGGDELTVLVDGVPRPMCCVGCQAVTSAIVDGGLEKFYQYRSANSATNTDSDNNDFSAYDLPEVQADLISVDEQGLASIELSISGISCAACAWLIEHHLQKLPGVSRATVNVSRQRCRIQWQQEQLALSQILSAFIAIGYRAHPAKESHKLEHIERDQKRYLLRLGVAGIGMMQTGMLAIALYAGAFQGMDEHWQHLLRWVSLLVATPVVLYAAQPFFKGAWRSLVNLNDDMPWHLHLSMDVPVALAIGLAYGASAWGTVAARGEVYFDAVSMLTFFLLLGRFLEMRVRYRNELVAGQVGDLIPLSAQRYAKTGAGTVLEQVPVKSLRIGDIIQVAEGECLAVDGLVVAGHSPVVEAVLSGEQDPVAKGPGDSVSAGTVNTTNPLKIQVSAVGQGTRLAAIVDMLDGVAAEKPQQLALADRLAAGFIGFVLLLAIAVFSLWWLHDADRALWVTLSVLVVTCPCALSLATPVVLAAATGRLQRQGFLVRSAHVLETLSKVTRVVLDKTGTLTTGKLEIDSVVLAADTAALDTAAALDIAAALEQGCRHPIASAFTQRQSQLKWQAEQLKYQLGGGVSGVINGQRYALGKPAFIAQCFALQVPPALLQQPILASQTVQPKHRLEVILASEQAVLARIVLVDELRPGARELVASLQAQGLALELLSGDQEKNTAALARDLGIEQWQANNSPEDKLATIRARQKAGDIVLMVGDGINDVPVLSGADISVAMAEATDFTRMACDAVLLSGNLCTLLDTLVVARKTARVIRQNVAWALLYNLSALPLAAMGWVPPWAAAIGMSASSLVVVLNALRLQRSNKGPGDKLDNTDRQWQDSAVASVQTGA
ncbi:MAG: heavy metal translocating P-type ATPase [Gammaproteobacteria bacterium]|nr:heavy metal translocating P-type ATPase [Gammaproteobacteria bacterium]MBQ0838151.1 heavy metal translocating P-type ATPase [Gammaproteobacteria bacterium]